MQTHLHLFCAACLSACLPARISVCRLTSVCLRDRDDPVWNLWIHAVQASKQVEYCFPLPCRPQVQENNELFSQDVIDPSNQSIKNTTSSSIDRICSARFQMMDMNGGGRSKEGRPQLCTSKSQHRAGAGQLQLALINLGVIGKGQTRKDATHMRRQWFTRTVPLLAG
jgi:hypothetical protein